MRLCQPMMATCCPHNNPLMEWMQTKSRMGSDKVIVSCRNRRAIVAVLKQGEAVWLVSDRDYAPKGSAFVPFFVINEAATTHGTLVLARLTGAALLTVTLIRKANDASHRLFIRPA